MLPVKCSGALTPSDSVCTRPASALIASGSRLASAMQAQASPAGVELPHRQEQAHDTHVRSVTVDVDTLVAVRVDAVVRVVVPLVVLLVLLYVVVVVSGSLQLEPYTTTCRPNV